LWVLVFWGEMKDDARMPDIFFPWLCDYMGRGIMEGWLEVYDDEFNCIFSFYFFLPFFLDLLTWIWTIVDEEETHWEWHCHVSNFIQLLQQKCLRIYEFFFQFPASSFKSPVQRPSRQRISALSFNMFSLLFVPSIPAQKAPTTGNNKILSLVICLDKSQLKWQRFTLNFSISF